MDADQDEHLSYKEFCGFLEEKRRNIDPFDGSKEQIKAEASRIAKKNLAMLKGPYTSVNVKNSYQIPDSKSSARVGSYDDLESQAKEMKIINEGWVNKSRKSTIPAKLKKNKDFTFGIPSDLGSHYTPGKFVLKHTGDSHMNSIMMHTDNLRADLQNKINTRLLIDSKKSEMKFHNKIHTTKAQELRSQSVIANKALNDYSRGLDDMQSHHDSTL